MVTKADFEQILFARFSNVPGITLEDAESIVTEMMIIYDMTDSVPSDNATKFLAFASSEMAMKIALNTAHYFRFTDGEESVDKTMVSENYRSIAKQYRTQFDELETYEVRKAKAKFSNAYRIDRPPFGR